MGPPLSQHGPFHFMPLTFMRPSLEHHLPLSPHFESLSATQQPIPATFDARNHFTACAASISTVRNQGRCGSCWAFGAVESLADRFCIASAGQITPKLSAQSLVDCDTTDRGCNGGFLDLAWEALETRGALAEDCDPYKHCAYPLFLNCTPATLSAATVSPPPPAQCPQSCTTGEIKWFKAASAYAVAPPGDVAAMQRELMVHGPFEVAFFVYSDFFQYTGGVYHISPKAQMQGSHAVKLVGWGEEDGVAYWTVANSWSPAWGEGGFFRIVRGVNEAGIESTPAAGLPLLPSDALDIDSMRSLSDRLGRIVTSEPRATEESESNAAEPAWPRARTRPTLQLQFSATERVSESDSGDGCITARKLQNPVVSRVWFDASNQRISQTNAGLDRHPSKPVTQVTRFDVKPPSTFQLEPFFNETICYEKPIGPVMCPNGSMVCPATFGHWGELSPFTSIFGMNYPNTSFLEIDPTTGEELWQWMWVKPTLMPNGSYVNITRNYTYYLAPIEVGEAGTAATTLRHLRRYEWTQGLPDGGDHSFRFCAVFDFSEDYKPGPPSNASFEPPPGVTCVNPGPSW